MELPHAKEESSKLGIWSVLAAFIGFLFLIMLSIPLLFNLSVVTLEEANIYVGVLSGLITLGFVSATLWTVIQNRRSIQQFEKENHRPIVNTIITNLIGTATESLEENLRILRRGEVDYKSLRSVSSSVSFEFRVPLPLDIEDERGSKIEPLGELYEPFWYHTFKETYPKTTERLEQYKQGSNSFERTTEQLVNSIENEIEEWFERTDLTQISKTRHIGDIPVDSDKDMSDLEQVEISIKELIDRSGETYNEVLNNVSKQIVREVLDIEDNDKGGVQSYEIFDTIEGELIPVLENRLDSQIAQYEKERDELEEDTIQLISELVEIKRVLKSEYGISD